jgi:hypothetical protein
MRPQAAHGSRPLPLSLLRNTRRFTGEGFMVDSLGHETPGRVDPGYRVGADELFKPLDRLEDLLIISSK